MISNLIAFNDMEEIVVLFIPMMVFAIPIIAILTHHQRKMAELFRQKHQQQSHVDPNLMHELHKISAQLTELRLTLDQHSIAIDDLQSTKSTVPESIRSRISQEQ